MTEAHVSDALRALSRFLVADVSLGDTLSEVAGITVDALPAAEFAGVTLLDDGGNPTTAVFTDPQSPEIDQEQYRTGRGPCLDAGREQRVVRLDDVSADGSYPEFAEACRRHGIFSTLSLPLSAAGKGVGALNLYGSQVAGFSEEDERLGMELATAASVVLANVVAYQEAYEMGQQLSEAIRSRAVIEQAKGMLMARSPGLDADGAFDLLRQASQRENRKLREIAQQIVDRNGASGAHPVGGDQDR
jgi:GAF domain-containing protein